MVVAIWAAPDLRRVHGGHRVRGEAGPKTQAQTPCLGQPEEKGGREEVKEYKSLRV